MKKLALFSLHLLFISASLFATNPKNLYEKLREVNSYWEKQTDVPQEVYTLPAILNEKEAIRTHLRYVEQVLRNRDVAHLTAIEQKNRLQNLDFLHTYWLEGNFPINDVLPYRNPIFIDKRNNFCAVGYIIKESGHESISREIQQTQNFAYLKDIQCAALESWAKDCGLSFGELAWIQPGYPPVGTANAMNNGLGGTVRDMYVEASGELTAVGNFSTDVSNWYSGFAGWDWFADCQGTNGTVFAIEKWNNEKIIGGDFTQLNGQAMSYIAKYNNNTGQYEAFGTLNGIVRDIKIYNNALYAAGDFGLAKWNGTDWEIVAAVNGTIKVLYVWNGSLVLGGAFSQIAGLVTQNIATFSDVVTVGFNALGNGLTENVNDLIAFKGKLYAGTDFTVGQTLGIWSFDGSNNWAKNEFYGTGTGIKALASDNETLYIGGNFVFYPLVGNYGNNLMIMNFNSGQCYFSGLADLDSTVYSLGIANNQLFVGGEFVKNINGTGTVVLNSIGYFMITSTPIAANITKIHFSLFPNPSQDFLRIKHSPKSEIQVFDPSGKAIFVAKQSISDTETQLDVQHLPAGIYLCKVGNSTAKWVKK